MPLYSDYGRDLPAGMILDNDMTMHYAFHVCRLWS